MDGATDQAMDGAMDKAMDRLIEIESTHYLLHCESGNPQIADRVTVHRRSWLSEEHALPGECVSSHN